MELLSKNTPKVPEICNNVSVCEQKPMKIYDFNETEECIEKRKLKRTEVVENNKLLKKYKKQEEIKKEAEIWTRLRELNNEFKNIKKQRKK